MSLFPLSDKTVCVMSKTEEYCTHASKHISCCLVICTCTGKLYTNRKLHRLWREHLHTLVCRTIPHEVSAMVPISSNCPFSNSVLVGVGHFPGSFLQIGPYHYPPWFILFAILCFYRSSFVRRVLAAYFRAVTPKQLVSPTKTSIIFTLFGGGSWSSFLISGVKSVNDTLYSKRRDFLNNRYTFLHWRRTTLLSTVSWLHYNFIGF